MCVGELNECICRDDGGIFVSWCKMVDGCHAIGSPTLQQGTTILSLSKIYSLVSF